MTQSAEIRGAVPSQADPVREVVPPTADRVIDLSAVAAEPPAESIAHENEIVEHIALEDEDPEHPDAGVVEQLQALIDPDEIRRH